MSRKSLSVLTQPASWTCRQCQIRTRPSSLQTILNRGVTRNLSASTRVNATIQVSEDGEQSAGTAIIKAAPKIDFKKTMGEATRVVPVSPSYFTTAPTFNDYYLRLTRLNQSTMSLPTVSSDQAPRILFMHLQQFQSSIGEKVGAAKFSRLMNMLKRLNQIHPDLRSPEVSAVLEEFRRPGSDAAIAKRPRSIDHFGRARGVGRRKSSTAVVQLVEGAGEVLVNGKGIAEAFPRLHDRESVIWPLKVTSRTDKYNAFIMTSGGGTTGQAESATLAIANALLIHEPALKPILRKGELKIADLEIITDNYSWLCHAHHEAC
jgi:small subunit ribosomal protein S9